MIELAQQESDTDRLDLKLVYFWNFNVFSFFCHFNVFIKINEYANKMTRAMS